MKTNQKRIAGTVIGIFLTLSAHALDVKPATSGLSVAQRTALGISMAWDAEKGCGTHTPEEKMNKSAAFHFLLVAGQIDKEMPSIVTEHISEKDLTCEEGHAELTPEAYNRLKNTPLL